MKPLAIVLVLLPILTLASIPLGSASPWIPPSRAPVNLWRNYSAPSSDVQQFYTSNGTPVVVGGNFVFSPNPTSVNVQQLKSAPGGGNQVVLTIKLKGPVGTTRNFTYVFDMYTDVRDQVHYVVNYTGGSGAMWLVSNKTSGFTPRNITGNASITSSSDNFRDQLVLTINLSLIPSVTAWDVDVMAQERDSYYTYRKFIYQVPGHPGTAPAAILGHVYIAGSNTPLANVTISTDVSGYTTLTNATGAYVLYTAPGAYNITAHRAGYQDVTYRVVVGLGSAITRDFQLSPLSFIDRVGILTLLIIVALIVGGVLAALFFLLRRRQGGQQLKPPIGP